jgi:hypothetical protein
VNYVTGDKAIDRVLEAMQAGAVKKIMRPAIAAGLRVSAKAMKAAVPANMKDAKKAIGSRFNKSKRTGELMAKAGAGVGSIGKKKNREKAEEKQKLKRGGRPGVGIGVRNIMWFILGTKGRRTESGKSTGSMPPQMDPVRQGFESSQASVMQKIVDVARTKLLGLAK